MFIKIDVELEDEEGGIKTVEACGRFYHGDLDDWYLDTPMVVDNKLEDRITRKLYQAYDDSKDPN